VLAKVAPGKPVPMIWNPMSKPAGMPAAGATAAPEANCRLVADVSNDDVVAPSWNWTLGPIVTGEVPMLL
jgi:hypothetical protein